MQLNENSSVRIWFFCHNSFKHRHAFVKSVQCVCARATTAILFYLFRLVISLEKFLFIFFFVFDSAFISHIFAATRSGGILISILFTFNLMIFMCGLSLCGFFSSRHTLELKKKYFFPLLFYARQSWSQVYIFALTLLCASVCVEHILLTETLAKAQL